MINSQDARRGGRSPPHRPIDSLANIVCTPRYACERVYPRTLARTQYRSYTYSSFLPLGGLLGHRLVSRARKTARRDKTTQRRATDGVRRSGVGDGNGGILGGGYLTASVKCDRMEAEGQNRQQATATTTRGGHRHGQEQPPKDRSQWWPTATFSFTS